MNSALTIAAATTAAAALVALAGAVEPVRAVANPIGLGANQQTGTFGDPVAAAPFWRLQHSSDCGEMAVADVVGQITGSEPTERKITSLARTTSGVTGAGPIYRRRKGTDIRNLPVLLAHYGIQSSLAESSIGGLEQDLAQGRKVIAAVNAQTIWNAAGDRGTDNHVVVVTGIDPQAGVVHLNDSGIKTGRDERVSLATFEKSWATSQDLAVVTS
jgi:Peptidase_C39 like family